MKKITKISVLILVMITLFSCDKLDELTEFDITQDFSTSVNIDVIEDSEGAAQSWSQSSTISIA